MTFRDHRSLIQLLIGTGVAFALFVACAPRQGPEARGGNPQAPRDALERSQPREKHTIDSDGHGLVVWRKPPRSMDTERNPAVLLLHGITWSALPNFDLQVQGEDVSLMDSLAAAGISVYALDARGYGETPRDETGWLTPDRAANDVVNVLEWMRRRRREGPRPVLFGYSYGSMVGQLTVQRRPDLVSGFVLFGYPYDPDFVRSPQDTPAEPPRQKNKEPGGFVEAAVGRTVIEAFRIAALGSDPIRVDWRDLQQWNELDPGLVTVPTLLIEGELDGVTHTDAHTRLFTRFGTPDRTWQVVPGGGHRAFLEAPRDIILTALTRFVHRASR